MYNNNDSIFNLFLFKNSITEYNKYQIIYIFLLYLIYLTYI